MIASDGSKGGAQGTPPPGDRIFFNFMQFSGNFNKIVSWRPPPWGLAPPPRGNPGSATDCVPWFSASRLVYVRRWDGCRSFHQDWERSSRPCLCSCAVLPSYLARTLAAWSSVCDSDFVLSGSILKTQHTIIILIPIFQQFFFKKKSISIVSYSALWMYQMAPLRDKKLKKKGLFSWFLTPDMILSFDILCAHFLESFLIYSNTPGLGIRTLHHHLYLLIVVTITSAYIASIQYFIFNILLPSVQN